MATKPKNVKLAKNGVDILNAIRNDASLSFQERVPVATQEEFLQNDNSEKRSGKSVPVGRWRLQSGK